MAERHLKAKKAKISPKKVPKNETSIVLVGTYKEKQLAWIRARTPTAPHSQYYVFKAKPPTCVEICAGAGGQAIGLERAGFAHVALVEYESEYCEEPRIAV